MNELLTADVLSTGVPLVVMLLGIYLFFKVAGFIVKVILAIVCLAMLAYLVMSFMGLGPNVVMFQGTPQ